MDGKVMQVVEFQHVKPGKGAAFVRTKMKDIINGGVTETSFNPTAKFEQAYVERKDMEYSYNDGDLYYFMDMETYDMIPISKDMLGDAFRFVKENMTCKVMSYKGSVFGVEPPNFVELEVTETDPGFKGDTATNVTKPATLETGAEIKVPLFINIWSAARTDDSVGYLRPLRICAGVDGAPQSGARAARTSVLAQPKPCRTPSRSEAFRSATAAQRRHLARRWRNSLPPRI